MVRKSALARLLADEAEERRLLPLALVLADRRLLSAAIVCSRRIVPLLLRLLLFRVFELLAAELGLLLLPGHRGGGALLGPAALVAALALALALLVRIASHRALGPASVAALLVPLLVVTRLLLAPLLLRLALLLMLALRLLLLLRRRLLRAGLE